jgi:hypothetical protein
MDNNDDNNGKIGKAEFVSYQEVILNVDVSSSHGIAVEGKQEVSVLVAQTLKVLFSYPMPHIQ